MIEHDLLIVGGGPAGLRAAVEACPRLKVGLVGRVHPVRSQSLSARVGISAGIGHHAQAAGDNPGLHALDTVKGADYLADQDAVQRMCELAPQTVFEMERWGMLFSRMDDGRIAQRPSGGEGMPRACYSADLTGAALVRTLYERAASMGLRTHDERLVTQLVICDGRVCGVIALNMLSGELEVFAARAVLFASGGCGRLYARSTNAQDNAGSGIALAYRAGVGIKDLEFVQFHPTSLAGLNVLITEAARGEGGRLINRAGERFMERYAPASMELAPCDVVARSIETEISQGRAFRAGFVHLDLRHLGKRLITERLPDLRRTAIEFAGVDPVDAPISVVSAQHYCMGGIDTDMEGRTEIEGLFAAGECACVSAHGANRLSGNCLLEALVFGHAAGIAACEHARQVSSAATAADTLRQAAESEEQRLASLVKGKGLRPYSLIERLGKLMSEQVGIFREEKALRSALDEIRRIRGEAAGVRVSVSDRRCNRELMDAFDLPVMIDLAEIITAGALRRTESRGCHSRTDYPHRDDHNWLVHTVAHAGPDGPVLSNKSVTITEYEPRERTY